MADSNAVAASVQVVQSGSGIDQVPENTALEPQNNGSSTTDGASGAGASGDDRNDIAEDEEQGDVDDEEDVEMDEDGLPLVGNPSQDIRGDLEDALGHADFQGSYYFSRSYDDAPNPILRLAELDTVGLPLSKRDAAAIIEKSELAPFGKGERTVVDKDVRDTWQMDAEKVSFDNPAWTSFMDRVVRDVCVALGVNQQASQPRCELYKLLLYETGSHFLPHVDTEKANNMFATVVIVLPTVFAGGDAHVSHGGHTAVLNSSATSLSKTTVLAWYTDVMHEIKPITSGYRLALSFNLVHTTTALRPSLGDDTSPLLRLRHVMLSWKQAESDMDRIVYLLDHNYSRANLSGSALKGSDAHVLAMLDEVAKELGFCIGVGTLCHTIRGTAEGDYGGYSDCNIEMGEIEGRSTTIDTLFDLDGRIIARNVDFDEEMDTIPEDFVTGLEDEQWDDEEYEGYQGNYAGDIERFYRRSVLLVWPPWGGPCRGGDRRAAYAMDRLALASGAPPTEEEVQFFNFVVESGQADKLPVLCKLAQQWHRGDLWQSAILALGGENKAAHERFAPVAVCGFGVAQSSIESFVRRCGSNTKRFEMLTMLESWANGQQPSALQEDVARFVHDQKSWILHHLRVPTEHEKQLVTDAAISYGGVAFLESIILPQLKKDVTYQYCDAYAEFLHDNSQTLAKSPEDSVVLSRIVADLLSSVVERTNYFPSSHAPAYHAGYAYNYKPKAAPETAFKLIKRCLDYGQVTLAARAIERMLDMANLTAAETSSRAVTVLLPLVPLLVKDLEASSPPPELPIVGKLGEVAVRLTFDSEFAQKGQLTKEDIDALLSAIVLGGNAELFTSLFIPKLKVLPWNASNWKAFLEILVARRKEPVFAAAGPPLDAVITEMSTTYAQKVDLPTSADQPTAYSAYPYYGGAGNQSQTGTVKIRDALDLCLRAGGVSCAKIVLDRVLRDRLLISAKFISDVLLPLIEHLVTLAKEHRLSLSAEPFAPAIRKVMHVWLEKVLGHMPDTSRVQPLLNTLARYSCLCPECKRVDEFLKKSGNREMTLDRIGAPKRKHVEQELSKWARGVATYDTVRTTPQGLKIAKTEIVLAPLQWKANQKIGLRALKALGKEPELRAIFGDQYPVVVGRLNGVAVGGIPSVPSHPAPATGVRPAVSRTTASSSAQRQTQTSAGAPARPRAVAHSSAAQAAGPSTVYPGIAAPVTPAKRKADTDVIDLCTP